MQFIRESTTKSTVSYILNLNRQEFHVNAYNFSNLYFKLKHIIVN